MKINVVKQGTVNVKPLLGCPTLVDEDGVTPKR